MKTWTDLSIVPMPPRIAALRRDSRGYPIAATVDVTRLPIDFTITDPVIWMRFVQTRLCGVCGVPLGAHKAFVGGPLSMANRVFYDLPMHRECAEYSLRVCPYLAAPRFAHRRKVPDGVHVIAVASDTRPNEFGLAIARNYHLVEVNGDVVLRAHRWEAPIEWWSRGERTDEPAIARRYAEWMDAAQNGGAS
jgi:hypothetical protein